MDIGAIRNQLRINRHRLDEELELQAFVAERISAEVARLNSRQLHLADALKGVEARLLLDLKDNGEKLTVAEIDAKIRRSRERAAAFGEFQAARFDHDEWMGLQDAWRQRSYALKDLANLYSSDYFSATQVSAGSSRSADRASRDSAVDQARERMTSRRAEVEVAKDPAPVAVRRRVVA
jgi:hypothetical protein